MMRRCRPCSLGGGDVAGALHGMVTPEPHESGFHGSDPMRAIRFRLYCMVNALESMHGRVEATPYGQCLVIVCLGRKLAREVVRGLLPDSAQISPRK